MLISDLLRYKGSGVLTIAPDRPVTELLAQLEEHHVGGLVVTAGAAIVGIISERDIVRHLHRHPDATLTATVGELMTVAVITCRPDDTIDAVAATMTEMRVRHMPVVADGALAGDGTLAGIVTIGDVVAARIRSLEQERIQLENYITKG
jgi:CBS domain-containing protein